MVYVKKYSTTLLSEVIDLQLIPIFQCHHTVVVRCVRKISKFAIEQYKGFGTQTRLSILNHRNQMRRDFHHLLYKIENELYTYLTYGELVTLEWMIRSHLKLLLSYKRSKNNLDVTHQLDVVQKALLTFDAYVHQFFENTVQTKEHLTLFL